MKLRGDIFGFRVSGLGFGVQSLGLIKKGVGRVVGENQGLKGEVGGKDIGFWTRVWDLVFKVREMGLGVSGQG